MCSSTNIYLFFIFFLPECSCPLQWERITKGKEIQTEKLSDWVKQEEILRLKSYNSEKHTCMICGEKIISRQERKGKQNFYDGKNI